MNILIVIGSLEAGGAERAAINIVNELAVKHSVTLLLLDGTAEQAYPVHSAVSVVYVLDSGFDGSFVKRLLNHGRRFIAMMRLIPTVKADVVVSFMTHNSILTLLTTWFSSTPQVIVEQIDHQIYFVGHLWRSLMHVTYGRAAHMVCSSQGVAEYFDWMPSEKITIIYNSIDITKFKPATAPEAPNTLPKLIAIGRLVPQKGFDLLIESVMQLPTTEWTLDIWGEGDLHNDLTALIRQYGLEDKIILRGTTQDIPTQLQNSDIFILSSRFEGFGNVIIEAMACGVPVVSFDCPSGPKEIIKHDHSGILVPNGDKVALMQAILRLLQNPALRQQLAEAGRIRAADFSHATIANQWEPLLHDIVENNSSHAH